VLAEYEQRLPLYVEMHLRALTLLLRLALGHPWDDDLCDQLPYNVRVVFTCIQNMISAALVPASGLLVYAQRYIPAGVQLAGETKPLLWQLYLECDNVLSVAELRREQHRQGLTQHQQGTPSSDAPSSLQPWVQAAIAGAEALHLLSLGCEAHTDKNGGECLASLRLSADRQTGRLLCPYNSASTRSLTHGLRLGDVAFEAPNACGGLAAIVVVAIALRCCTCDVALLSAISKCRCWLLKCICHHHKHLPGLPTQYKNSARSSSTALLDCFIHR
jgi:hypothetical protein